MCSCWDCAVIILQIERNAGADQVNEVEDDLLRGLGLPLDLVEVRWRRIATVAMLLIGLSWAWMMEEAKMSKDNFMNEDQEDSVVV